MRDLSRHVHLWLLDVPGQAPPEAETVWKPLLSDDERARGERVRLASARCQQLAGRALARAVLSRYRPDVEPRAWRFTTGPHGRPEIEGPETMLHRRRDGKPPGGATPEAGGETSPGEEAASPTLRFNLSHTDGLVACVVTVGIDCGVDVERCHELQDLMGVAATVFSGGEMDALRRLEGRARRERFFASWTLKEAYVKARGEGFHLPLKRIDVRLHGASIDLRLDPGIDDAPEAWRLWLARRGAGHRLAVALRAGDRALDLAAHRVEADLRTVHGESLDVVARTGSGGRDRDP